MQTSYRKVGETASSRFDYEWKITNYIPVTQVSPDFFHPLFPQDILYLTLHESNSGDAALIKLYCRSAIWSPFGVTVWWNNEKLDNTMITSPSIISSSQAPILLSTLARKPFKTPGIESLWGTSFTIKASFLYPSNLVPGFNQNTLTSNIGLLLQDQSFLQNSCSRDFTLIAEDGKSVKIHSFILAATSSVMKAMLTMEPSKENQNREMMFKETPFHVLELFVKYVYSDNIDVAGLNLKCAIDAFMFSDQYDILGFKFQLETFISGNIKSQSDVRLAKEVVLNVDSTLIEAALKQFRSSVASDLKKE